MAGYSTIYDVMLRYRMEDRATRGVRALESSTRSAAYHSGFLVHRLKSLAFWGTTLGTGFVLSSMTRFNSLLEQARITTASFLQQSFGGEFSDHVKSASNIISQLTERAKRSTSTTAEFVQMLTRIALPVTKAGLGADKLADFTANLAIAAKAYGDENIAALDIEQALLSNLTIRDRFATKLLFTIGMTREEFNKLDKEARLSKLQEALGSKPIQELATAQQFSFAGVMSTLKDNLQITLGRIGLPLFKAMADEAKKLNQWFTDNPEKIRMFARDFGETIKSAFTAIKDVMSWIVRHKDFLIGVAKALLIYKAAGRLQGFAGGLVLGQAARHAAAGMEEAATKSERLAGKINTAIAGVALFAIAVQSAADALDSKADKMADEISGAPILFLDLLKRGAGGRSLSSANVRTLGRVGLEEGIIDRYGNVNRDRLRDAFKRAHDTDVLTDPYGVYFEQMVTLLQQIADKQAANRVEEFIPNVGARFRDIAGSIFGGAGGALVGSGRGSGIIGAFEKIFPSIGRGLGEEIESRALFNKGAFMISDAAFKLERVANDGYAAWFESVLFFTDGVNVFTKFVKMLEPVGLALGTLRDMLKFWMDDKKKGKGTTRVTIGRIEVVSDDPDRFAFDFVSAMDDMASNPSNALTVIRESG